jgi:hypothetical protein
VPDVETVEDLTVAELEERGDDWSRRQDSRRRA